jgi:hypothetical protein
MLVQQTALTAAASMSKHEETKRQICLVSAFNWAASAVTTALTREDMQEKMVPVNMAFHLGMSTVLLAGAGVFKRQAKVMPSIKK